MSWRVRDGAGGAAGLDQDDHVVIEPLQIHEVFLLIEKAGEEQHISRDKHTHTHTQAGCQWPPLVLSVSETGRLANLWAEAKIRPYKGQGRFFKN